MAGRSGRIGNETGRNVSAREKRGFGVELMGLTLRRFLCVLLSAALLAAGWLGLSGLPLVVALVPLLWISRSYGSSRRDLPKGVFTPKTQYFREKFLRVVFLLYICTPQTAQITKQKGYGYGNEKNVPAVAPEENQQARFPPENVHG